MSEKKKITIYDLAASTGFSVRTVNRALSGQGRINEDTRRLILEAAKKAGYRPNPAAQGLRRKPIKLGAILYSTITEYIEDLCYGMQAATDDLEQYNVTIDLRPIPYTTNEECRKCALELLQQFYDEKYDGVLLFESSLDTETDDFCRLINQMAEDGIPVVTIANDIPQSNRLFFVGIDAFTAGKMAAELLRLTSYGKDVAVLTHSVEFDINRRYVEGFCQEAGEDTFRSIRIYSHYDEPDLVIQKTEQIIKDNPSLDSIYMTSAASRWAGQHLRAMGIKGYKVVLTDLLDGTSELVSDGTAIATIFQDPYRQGKNAIMHLYDYLVNKKKTGDHMVTPILLLRPLNHFIEIGRMSLPVKTKSPATALLGMM